MICFYCGRLGHGSNDCVEVGGDSTPERNCGPSPRASPCKFSKEDMGYDRGSKEAGKEVEQERRLEGRKLVNEVANFFNEVSLVQEDVGRTGEQKGELEFSSNSDVCRKVDEGVCKEGEIFST